MRCGVPPGYVGEATKLGRRVSRFSSSARPISVTASHAKMSMAGATGGLTRRAVRLAIGDLRAGRSEVLDHHHGSTELLSRGPVRGR